MAERDNTFLSGVEVQNIYGYKNNKNLSRIWGSRTDVHLMQTNVLIQFLLNIPYCRDKKVKGSNHRLINDNIHDSRCGLLWSRSSLFTITLRQKPIGVPSRQRWITRQREREQALPARNSFGLLSQGYCERKLPKSWKDDI